MLSTPLGTVDLTTVNGAELTDLIAQEGARLLHVPTAVVWKYREPLDGFVLERPGEEPQTVVAPGEDVRELLGKGSLWKAGGEAGIRRSLVTRSFPAEDGSDQPPVVLGMPLFSQQHPVGLLLARLESADVPDGFFSRIEHFARQAGALLANHDALVLARERQRTSVGLANAASQLFTCVTFESLLRVVVNQARALVDVPLTYLMTAAPGSKELVVRASSGTRSPSFADLRLEVGSGLDTTGGQDGESVYSMDYPNDRRFRHSPVANQWLRQEGIKSILAVPFVVGDQSAGILYAAERRIRTFSPAHIEALTGLANQARLAHANSALYEEVKQALTTLAAASEVVRAENERLRRAVSALSG
jgi:GAF domain-containing protein